MNIRNDCNVVLVPSAPRNFTLTTVQNSPNILFASWRMPELSNGIISGYAINCSLSMGEQRSFDVGGTVTNATLENLLPFTSYTCTISARTGAGPGSLSDPQTASTDEDGK